MPKGADAFGDDVGGLEQGVVVFFGQFVQRLEQRADDVPVIDVALDDELVRVGENVGERGRHLLAIGLLQPDVEFLVLDLRFQHGGCLCHDLSPIRFGNSYWVSRRGRERKL
ncbi:hypothetical protein D9M68_964920 [compost metagenome]